MRDAQGQGGDLAESEEDMVPPLLPPRPCKSLHVRPRKGNSQGVTPGRALRGQGGAGRKEAGGLAVPPTAPTELGTNRCSKSATEGEIYCSVNYFKENDKNSRAENGV